MEGHLQVVLGFSAQTLHQDDAVGDCCHPSVSRFLIMSNLRSVGLDAQLNWRVAYQVNWWHVTVVVEDN